MYIAHLYKLQSFSGPEIKLDSLKVLVYVTPQSILFIAGSGKKNEAYSCLSGGEINLDWANAVFAPLYLSTPDFLQSLSQIGHYQPRQILTIAMLITHQKSFPACT